MDSSQNIVSAVFISKAVYTKMIYLKYVNSIIEIPQIIKFSGFHFKQFFAGSLDKVNIHITDIKLLKACLPPGFGKTWNIFSKFFVFVFLRGLSFKNQYH